MSDLKSTLYGYYVKIERLRSKPAFNPVKTILNSISYTAITIVSLGAVINRESVQWNLADRLTEFFQDNIGAIYIVISFPLLFFALGLVYHILFWWFEHSPLRRSDMDATALELIGFIVKKKKERFSEAAQSDPRLASSAQVFDTITQPMVQLNRLTEAAAVGLLMSYDRPSLHVHAVLAEMGDEHVKKFLCSFPEPPKRHVEDLQGEDCTFSRAKRLQRMVIVPKISKEARERDVSKRMYRPVRDSELEEKGSVICMPVFVNNRDDIPLVLSVSVHEENLFQHWQSENWKNFLGEFASRMALEYCLLRLREGTAEKT